MKCAAKYTRAKNARDTTAAEFVACLDAVTGTALRKFGFGRDRLQDMYDRTQRALSDVMIKCMAADTTEAIRIDCDDGDGLRDTAETAIWDMRGDLMLCGFDYFAESARMKWRDPYEGRYIPQSIRSLHDSRIVWCENVEHIANVYILNVLVYAHTERGFGRARLTTLHDMIRGGYNEYIETWLRCTPRDEKMCADFIKQRMDALESIGLETEDLKGE